MACHEYKITFEYNAPLLWTITVWQREVLVYDQRSNWRSIAHHQAATLEGHVDSVARLRQVLKFLVTT